MFDPYYKWLGIPPNEQPPNHYRLLGLQLFESNAEVIEAAANRQMAYVQQRASGKHAAVSQKLLNELSAARVCLLDPKKKAAYDDGLRRAMATHQPDAMSSETPSVQSEMGLDLGGFVSAVTPRRHLPPTRRRKPRWPLFAMLGMAILVLVVIGVVVATSNKDRELTPEAGGRKVITKSALTTPAENSIAKPSPKPEPKVKAKQEAEPVESDEKEPPSEAEKSSSPAETPEKAEERLKGALADAKSPDDYRTVASETLKVFAEAVAGNQLDLSKRLATMALIAARKADDDVLAADAAFCFVTGRRCVRVADVDPPGSGINEASFRTATSTVEEDRKAKAGKDRWLVLFRSADPSIWNSDVNRGKDNFAISLSAVPKNIKYLRMRADGQKSEVIIPIEKTQLGVWSENGRFGWNGMNYICFNARHLGIFCPGNYRPFSPGEISVSEAAPPGSSEIKPGQKGFGFGHYGWENNRQGYTWDGVTIAQTVFEIAVKTTTLRRKAQKAVLK